MCRVRSGRQPVGQDQWRSLAHSFSSTRPHTCPDDLWESPTIRYWGKNLSRSGCEPARAACRRTTAALGIEIRARAVVAELTQGVYITATEQLVADGTV